MVIKEQTMTNSDFLAEVYGELAPGEFGWVCHFRADPSTPEPGKWAGRSYKGQPAQAATIDRATQDNTYFCTAVLRATEDGEIVRRKDAFVRLAVLVLDDVQLSDVTGYSYAIQTSPGKFQVGIFLDGEDPDARNRHLVDRVMSALASRGRSNDASGNACCRYTRLPVGANTKPRAAGVWQVQLESWSPNVRWSLEDACAAVGIDLDALRSSEVAKPNSTSTGNGNHAGEMIAGLVDPNLGARAYHDSITRLAASLVAGGMFPGAAVEHLYSLMDAAKPDMRNAEEYRRWEARRAEIPRAVKSAEKFAPTERQASPISVKLNVGAAGAVGASAPATDGEAQPMSLLIGLDELQKLAGNIKWQVKHLIPDNSLGMFFGASGTYKSFIALDHCLHVAHGMQWLGHKTRKGGVVYVAAEGGAGIYRRVQAWHQHRKLALAQNFHVCTTPLVLSISEHIEALAAAIAALPEKPSLIYVDTLSQTFEGDENSATDISAYLRAINALIRAKFECTVVVIHHSGHAASERPRGSSAITANIDFMFGVYKPEGTSQLARLDVIKQKDGDRLANLAFRLNRVVLGQDEDGEEITSLAAESNDIAGRLMANAMQKLSAHEQLISRLLKAADGLMTDHDLRHAFYNAMGQESSRGGKPFNQDSARRSYGRGMSGLLEKGVVSVNAVTGMVQMVGANDE